ncbi:MAG: transcription-repair coupling factor [Candidatus Sumerlaeia bacterium]
MPDSYQQQILDQVDISHAFQKLAAQSHEAGEYARLLNLSGSARALVIARLQQRLQRPVLVVTSSAEESESWYEDFMHFGAEGLHHFPMTETLPFEAQEPIVEIAARQYSSLYYLRRGEKADNTNAPADRENPPAAPPSLIVAPLEALHRKIAAPEAFDKMHFTMWWGERMDLDTILHRLIDMGYERQAMVEARGEFSVRGHIIDIYSPQFEYPVRFDLFDDEIESMRFFSPATQRSLPDGNELERVTILPVSIQEAANRLGRESQDDPGAPRLISLLDWLAEDAIVVLDSPEKYDKTLEQLDGITIRRYRELTGDEPMSDTVEFTEPNVVDIPDASNVLPPDVFFLTGRDLQQRFNEFAQVLIPQLRIDNMNATGDYDFGVQAYDTLPPDLDAYISLIRSRQQQDYFIHIICDNEGQVMRLDEMMRENDIDSLQVIPPKEKKSDNDKNRKLYSNQISPKEFKRRKLLEGYQEIAISIGLMHTGFIFPDARLLIVTDREMFGRYKRRHVYRKAYKGRPISGPGDIQRGDYIVHMDHGVGRYLGIRQQKIDGQRTELLDVEYAEGNKLLVPIENVGRIQKYSSTEGSVPALDRLGGTRWQKRKKKSQEQIEKMAEELLQIYAQREAAQGHAFNPDTVWMTEFEESFLYQETPDQMKAIEEIKNDMAKPKPMDRLLCGDVGFGKTEVAIRAVFKCVEEGKQVAVLVPTTILAQQHYTNFKERFADYPFKIDMISRFRTAAEQREVIKKLRVNDVNIVIGTHRLLSQDVKFADLGLLVVDEEHRFGVKQKEKIKALRASVDILTLSATPIPRTLHMALSGLRDMSTINTPPRDRLPIRTSVIRFKAHEIEEAVMRELNRGGQIYFVHNRVQNIHQVAEQIQEIIPQARIAIGHGQMPERELEKIMFDFIDRKHDILLATTIIESGLDIPNVNTIIINRADAFGLAQLYQLRGRVGRDVKRAYAYLIVPEGHAITDTAIKRLRAIEEFTELGMGFQVAMRDLEIRGTGNLLGPQQHGAIDAVGFDLYCHLLEDAVKQLQGKPSSLDEPVEIHWSAPAFLPSEYVPVESQRIGFYKRCATAAEIEDMEDLKQEFRDRYGEIPIEAQNLINISIIRVLARQAYISRIRTTANGFEVMPKANPFDFMRMALPLQDRLEALSGINATGEGGIRFEVEDWQNDRGLEIALDVLKSLVNGDEDSASA